MELTIAKLTGSDAQKLALTNCVYLNPSDHSTLGDGDVYLLVKETVYSARANPDVQPGELGVNSIHRRMCGSVGDRVTAAVFSPSSSEAVGLAAVTVNVDYVQKAKARGDSIDAAELAKDILARFQLQFLTAYQQVAIEHRGENILLAVASCEPAGGSGAPARRGLLVSSTEVMLAKAPGTALTLTGLQSGASAAKTNIFRSEFNFEKMGIGGLDKEFSDIFRRAYAPPPPRTPSS